MTRKQQLENAIETIARWRGVEDTSVFTIVPVSRDCAGVVIMGTRWPEGGRLYRELRNAVRGFPEAADATCVALLPDVVDEIIATARIAFAHRRESEQAGSPGVPGTRAEVTDNVVRLRRGRLGCAEEGSCGISRDS